MIATAIRHFVSPPILKHFSSLCRCNLLSLARHFSTSRRNQSAIRSTVYDFLVNKHHFSPESASKIASGVARLRSVEHSDSVVVFLKESGFSTPQLEKTIKRRPQVLSANLDRYIKPKIKVFQELGISASDIAEIISNDPLIFKHSVENRILPNLFSLKSMFGSNDLAKIIKAFRGYFKLNLSSTLLPNVNLLKTCGVSMDQIFKMMNAFPRFLTCPHKDMKKFVDEIDKLGVSRRSKMFIYAVRVRSGLSDKTWKLKLRILREIGFSNEDIAGALQKSPSVFGYSEERIKEAKKVLLRNGKYDWSCIVAHPVSLVYSLEKRHKPRLRVLELLEGKKLIQGWPSFSIFYRMSNLRFYEKYVAPFPEEVREIYGGNRCEISRKMNAVLSICDELS
ncbi:transcription termination factor MTERF15, mitochondrial-like [Andrographis paniculata]|uniref:transcription termination factor MTERF15, mitochondrial-like n=1 Tax=Andrographis paniculata TaxID=175694 RepID=UPI0021E7DACC|nr:transcription termination factor MTERF15, mitochondrial-like [Andrographis paniculata]XP_051126417.1 transcription termination factor MTERF15, mitochondrial-like [Andrographis paniculata]XP_051126418.1 transcription termination factor MTERF15, mitochondrial-like [Andrographis paniculata]